MIGPFQGEYRFLSNFYRDETGFAVENAYQAAKTLDPKWQAAIMASSASVARALGQRAPKRADWEAIRIPTMQKLLEQKFQHPDLRARLLATGDQELVELNTWHDTFWGRCTCPRCGGKGENHLGRLLMALRAELSRASGTAVATTAAPAVGRLITCQVRELLTLPADIRILATRQGRVPGAITCRALAPSPALFHKAKLLWRDRPKREWWLDYVAAYQQEMAGPEKQRWLRMMLKSLRNGRDIVLACYCTTAECHRELIADWFAARGFAVERRH